MSTATTVAGIYTKVLQRDPSAAETATWVALIDGKNASVTDLTNTLIASPEANNFVDPVVRVYQAVFGRVPEPAGLDFWVDAYRGGTSLATITQGFVASTEFATRYGTAAQTGTVTTAYISQLYQNILGRAPDPAGFAFWLGANVTPARMLELFTTSTENISITEAPVNTFLGQLSRGETVTGPLGGGTGPTIPGQTFALTVSGTSGTFDNITGTAGNDTFQALAFASLEDGDVIAGGNGTDVLNARFNLTAAASVTPSLTSVENLFVRFANGDAANAHTLTVAGSGAVGLQQVWADTSATAAAGAADTIKVTNITTAVTAGVKGDSSNLLFEVVYDGVSGTNDSSTLALNAGKAGTVTIAGIENLTVSGTGASTLGALTAAAAKNLVITGDGATTISSIAGSTALTKVDASAATGAVTVGASATTINDAVTSVTGGKGNDTFFFTTSQIATTDTIDGGDGSDVIGLAGGLAVSLSNVKNFEMLRFGDNSNYDVSKVVGITSVRTDSTGGTSTISGMTTQAVTVTGDAPTTLNTNFTAASSTLKVALDNTLGRNADGVDLTTLSTANVSKVEITSTDGGSLTGANANSIGGMTGVATVLVNASARTEVTSARTDSVSIDASASTARVDITTTSGTDKAATVIGSNTGSTITTVGGNDIITGGTGNDTITSGAGKDSIVGGVGNDTIQFAYANLTTDDTIAGGDGTDTLSFTGIANGDDVNLTGVQAARLSNVSSIEVISLGVGALGAGQTGTLTIDDASVAAAGGSLTIKADNAGNAGAITAINANAVVLSSSTVTSDFGAVNNIINYTVGNNKDVVTMSAQGDTLIVATSPYLGATDTINGGSGTDVVKFTSATNSTVTTAQLGSLSAFEQITVNTGAAGNYQFTLNDAFLTANNNALAFTLDRNAADTGTTKVDASAVSSIYSLTLTGAGGTGANDTLTGGAGNDIITGAGGNDTIVLTAGGADRILFADKAHGVDTVSGFTLRGSATTAPAGVDRVDVLVDNNGVALGITGLDISTTTVTAGSRAVEAGVFNTYAGGEIGGTGNSLVLNQINVITTRGYNNLQQALEANSTLAENNAAVVGGAALVVFFNISTQRTELWNFGDLDTNDAAGYQVGDANLMAVFDGVSLAGLADFRVDNFGLYLV